MRCGRMRGRGRFRRSSKVRFTFCRKRWMGFGVIGRIRNEWVKAPKGRLRIARPLQRRDNIEATDAVPEGRLKLTPDIRRVVFDSVLLEKSQELFFKSSFVMMFSLGTDVGNCVGLLRDAHGKCAVSCLPCKGVRS